MDIYMNNKQLEAVLNDYENASDTTKDAICSTYLAKIHQVDKLDVLEMYTYLSIFVAFRKRFPEFRGRCDKFPKDMREFVTAMVPFILLDGSEHRVIMDTIRAGKFTPDLLEKTIVKLKEWHANCLPGLDRNRFMNFH